MRPALIAASLLCATAAFADPTPATPAKPDPVAERAEAIKEAGQTLEKANAQRLKGNKNFAEQLFSSAELLVGSDALAEVAPLFREGAPPRITTPLKQLPKDAAPQPAAVGSSEEEEPPKPEPKRGSLSGTLSSGDKPFVGRGVVTLEPASGKSRPRPPKDRVMEQRNREFAPKVLVVRLGSTVSFPNFDTVYHNVFSRSDARAFDLGIYKNGQSRELTFDKEGIVRVGCNLHANMSGYIVVVNAPHYAITDDKGNFKFRSLAPGRYRLKAWSERTTQPTVKDVTIEASDNTVKVSLQNETAGAVDKFGVSRGK